MRVVTLSKTRGVSREGRRRRRSSVACGASPAGSAKVTDEASCSLDAAAASSVGVALREWASVVESLRCGETTVLLRKGGIAEKGFKVKSRDCLMYPTSFHNVAALLQARSQRFAAADGTTPGDDAVLSLSARVTGMWCTADARVLEVLSPFHPWSSGLLETRFSWRPMQPITVVELRAFEMPQPVTLPGVPEHKSCSSWVPLPPELKGLATSFDGPPVLSDDEFSRRQGALREALATLDGVTAMPVPL